MIRENNPVSEDAPPNLSPSGETGLPGREAPDAVSARAVVSFEPKQEFALKTLPGTVFRITRISRASGATQIPFCSGNGKFIFLPDPGTPSQGTCIPESKLTMNGSRFGLAVVELEIVNQSKAYISSRFLQVFYNPETGDDIESKLAAMNPLLASYGALPQTSRRVVVAFMIPESQEQIQLVYGDYGKAPGFPESQELLLGKSVSGWIVNFAQKTALEIPG
jgi:hypothetical protein